MKRFALIFKSWTSVSIALMTGMGMMASYSCTEGPCSNGCDIPEGNTSRLRIELLSDSGTPDTRSTEAPTAESDNRINTLDIFIFRNIAPTSKDYQKLDTYKRFEGSDLDLNNLEITTTTGDKTICVIANSHISDYSSVINMGVFRTLVSRLQNEKPGDFTMYGEENSTLGLNSSVSISLERFVGRIKIASIKTAFTGPYTGMNLTDCQLFLINAHGDKLIFNGTATDTPVILNNGKIVAEDINSTAYNGLLMDNIAEYIDDSGYTVPHYFYCYANETDNIDVATKIVLKASIDGVEYYYPIPVNQTNYGYAEANGHYGIRRNTEYSYGITVTRPGSTDPNEPVVPGSLVLSILDIKEWEVIPGFEKIF